MEKFIKEYEKVMQENTELKVKLLLKEQYQELSHHEFTNDDLITFKKLLEKHIYEVEYKFYAKSNLNPLLKKVKNILDLKYGLKE